MFISKGQLYDAASTIMQQRLSQIQGVGQVSVGGSSLPAVRVEINPTQLNSYGLGLQDVSAMLSRQNANIAKGQIWDNNTTADIVTNDQLLKADDYKPLVVGYHNGAAVKLSDIADVQDSVENIRAAGFVNGKPSVIGHCFPAARRKHHRHGGPHPGGAALAQEFAAFGNRLYDRRRSDYDDPGLGSATSSERC